jgi:predicted nucleic acid-binding Zn ribbon protein
MERIGEEVSRELARGGSREALPLARITAAWPDAVGTSIARNAWPLRVSRDATLHVATASATWSHELDLLRGEVLEQLRARLGDDAPVGLRFAVGPVPEPPASPEAAATPSRGPVEVPPEIESEARAAAAKIEDPELRELVRRAARASLVKARSGRRFW